MTWTKEQAEADLKAWRANNDSRDERVLRAYDEAQLTINRISVVSGIGRPTIYDILERNGRRS
jgi:hypothetical protein